ncbi:acetyltransferase, partial [Xanthomonas hyacinthi DSM 19077]
MAARGGTIFHRRGSNHSLASVMAVMVERLRAGRAVAVFPEGGTGHNGVLRIFHARIFQAALDAEVPV